MAQYEINPPIVYRTLSGFDLKYDLIVIERTKNGHVEVSVSESTGLPRSLEPVLTVNHIHCSEHVLALKQHSPCIQIANELIRRNILVRDNTHSIIHSRFVDYALYRFNEQAVLNEQSNDRQQVS